MPKVKPSKEANAVDGWDGKFNIPYSRATVTEKNSSEAIGAGDVGNPFHSSNDSTPDDLSHPLPSKK